MEKNISCIVSCLEKIFKVFLNMVYPLVISIFLYFWLRSVKVDGAYEGEYIVEQAITFFGVLFLIGFIGFIALNIFNMIWGIVCSKKNKDNADSEKPNELVEK